MSKFQGFLNQHRDTILLLLLAGGFAVALGELVLYQHWEGTQLIGFSATVIGLLAVLAGIFVKGTLRTIVGLLLVVLSIAGLLGAREHLGASSGEAMFPRPALVQQGSLSGIQEVAYRPGALAQEGEEEGEAGESGEGGGETVPPPLAPLSLSGLALMGAVILLAKKDEAAA